MRQPANPGWAGTTQPPRAVSSAVSVTVDVYESQPTVSPPDTATSKPVGRLSFTSGTFTDDATRLVARTMTLRTSGVPDYVQPGMWLVPTIGIQHLQPIMYRLPSMVIEDITVPLDKIGGAAIECADATSVVNGRPFERDTSLFATSATLQNLVTDSFTLALSRPGHHADVPALDMPKAAIAEFGAGRWDVCVRMADSLGYALYVDDLGDVHAYARSATTPVADSAIERSLLPGGMRHLPRTPTHARLLVTRGSNLPVLIGKADAVGSGGSAPPSWYRPLVVTDRVEGPEWWNQGYADQAAREFLRARLLATDHFESLPILPSPWLEAGRDTVMFYGVQYRVLSVTLDLPSLATTVNLGRVTS